MILRTAQAAKTSTGLVTGREEAVSRGSLWLQCGRTPQLLCLPLSMLGGPGLTWGFSVSSEHMLGALRRGRWELFLVL